MTIILISCAQEYKELSEYKDNFLQLEGFNLINLFVVKENIFSMHCDIAGNKLIMKFSTKEKKWKKSKYISKSC